MAGMPDPRQFHFSQRPTSAWSSNRPLGHTRRRTLQNGQTADIARRSTGVVSLVDILK